MKEKRAKKRATKLRKGDPVMVIAGGNNDTRQNKGKHGNIVRFVGKAGEKAIVDGLNMVTKHTRASEPGKPSGKVPKESPIHVSNLMYYVEKHKKPVRLKHQFLEDGRKVRGYLDPETKDFVQLES